MAFISKFIFTFQKNKKYTEIAILVNHSFKICKDSAISHTHYALKQLKKYHTSHIKYIDELTQSTTSFMILTFLKSFQIYIKLSKIILHFALFSIFDTPKHNQ